MYCAAFPQFIRPFVWPTPLPPIFGAFGCMGFYLKHLFERLTVRRLLGLDLLGKIICECLARPYGFLMLTKSSRYIPLYSFRLPGGGKVILIFLFAENVLVGTYMYICVFILMQSICELVVMGRRTSTCS